MIEDFWKINQAIHIHPHPHPLPSREREFFLPLDGEVKSVQNGQDHYSQEDPPTCLAKLFAIEEPWR